MLKVVCDLGFALVTFLPFTSNVTSFIFPPESLSKIKVTEMQTNFNQLEVVTYFRKYIAKAVKTTIAPAI